MRYISTRGSSVERRFSEILMGGLAPDGGLYVPIAYPKVDDATLQHWRGLSYAELALEIVSLYIDDIPPGDLRAMMCKTYTAQTYCNVREGESAAQIAPLKTLGIENGAPISLLELSNGPTLAFKDMAMQLLGNLFEYTLAKQERRSISSARRPATPAAQPNTRCAASRACAYSCCRRTGG